VRGSKGESRGFWPLEHTADRSMEAWGKTLAELFRAAAEGMFSASVSCAGIPAQQEWVIEVEGDTLEDLLQAWLSELLWVSERDEAAVCRIEVEAVTEDPWRARGRAWGGPMPADRPHTGAPVKAVTYQPAGVPYQAGRRPKLVLDEGCNLVVL